MEAAGTRVDRIRPDSVKNSTPPERNWPSTSVSEPSCPLEKTWMSTRPPVSARMACDICRARMFMGCVAGRLLAYL
ncbi:hypothetical protein GY15_00890 [Delftia sp. 670]|nr:hypothetical protein GY15_00890 [Delftia sp. 670]